MSENSKQIGYLSVLRVLACVCIVVLHCFKYSCSLASDGIFVINDSQMNISLIIQYVMNWAVPCFVMITGALLLDPARNITYKKIFGKYILRMVIAIVVFSVLFEFIDALLSGESITLYTLANGLKNAALNKSWVHMWYLYMVIAIYLMLPIFRKITADTNKRDILYLIVLLGVFLIAFDITFNGIIKSLSILNQSESLSSDLQDISNPAFYIFIQKVWPLYLFLGYAVHKEFVKIKPVISVVLILSGIVFISFFVLLEKTVYNEAVKSICYVLYSFNSSPGFLLIALGVFSLFYSFRNAKSGVLFKIIRQVDICSFGIYLVHIIPIKVFMVKLGLDPYKYGGVFGVLWFSLAVLVISFAAVWLFKRILLLCNIKINSRNT